MTTNDPTFDERQPGKEPVTRAYLQRAAMAYLERYASSGETLRRVLRRKAERRCREAERQTGSDRRFDPEGYFTLIDEVVAACRNSALIDDDAYARAKTASLRRRGASARLIRAKLAAKGIDTDTATAALQDNDDEQAAAFALAKRRKLGPFRATQRAEHRLKDLARLGRAGFSSDVARAVIDAEEPVLE